MVQDAKGETSKNLQRHSGPVSFRLGIETKNIIMIFFQCHRQSLMYVHNIEFVFIGRRFDEPSNKNRVASYIHTYVHTCIKYIFTHIKRRKNEGIDGFCNAVNVTTRVTS
jgi:hypothetical protein